MVGKKSSLTPLKEELRKLKIQNFSTTEFCQGKTMRWGLGWSLDDSVKFPKSVFKEKQKDKRPPLTFLVPENVPMLMYTVEGIAYQIKEYFKELQIKCEEKSSNETKITMVITAVQNTWSNQRRKRRQGKQKEQQEEPMERDENKNKVKICNADNGGKMEDDVSSSSKSLISHKRKLSADLDKIDYKIYTKVLKTDEDGKLSISDLTVDIDLKTKEKQKQQHEKPVERNENKNKVEMSDSDCGSSQQDDVSSSNSSIFHKGKLSADLNEIGYKNPLKFLKTDEDGKLSISKSTVDTDLQTEEKQKQQHEKPAERNENKNKIKMSDSDCGSSLQDGSFISHKRTHSADLDEIDYKNPSKFLKTDEDGKLSISDSSCSDVIKTCAQEIEGKDSYIFKCNVSVKQIEDEQIVIEMSWINGKIREAMNQVLQYLKNKLKSSD